MDGFNRWCACMVFVLSVFAVRLAAGATEGHAEDEMRGWRPVEDTVLAGMRGGFQQAPDNAFVSFGIEKAVFINGQLASSTNLTMPNATQFINSLNLMTFIQEGMDNSVASRIPANVMTIIQNTLDNQLIQNRTTITAEVSALGLARSLDLGASVNQAIHGSIRP